MFGFYHFIKIQIGSGFSHICVLLSNHFEDVLLSDKFHTCVIFTQQVVVRESERESHPKVSGLKML